MLMRARVLITSWPCLTKEERTGNFTKGFGDAVRRNARGIAWGLAPGRARSFLPGLAFVVGELGLGRRGWPNPDFALNSPAGLRGLFCPPKAAIANTLLKAWGEKG